MFANRLPQGMKYKNLLVLPGLFSQRIFLVYLAYFDLRPFGGQKPLLFQILCQFCDSNARTNANVDDCTPMLPTVSARFPTNSADFRVNWEYYMNLEASRLENRKFLGQITCRPNPSPQKPLGVTLACCGRRSSLTSAPLFALLFPATPALSMFLLN